MADPDVYSRDYSFTDFQADSPASPLPGNEVDSELNSIAAVTVDIVAAIADVRRSDGALKNGIVTEDSLAADVLVAFQDQVDAAEGFADAAAASAAAAASDESSADAHRVAAAASASSASTSAGTATTQAATATTQAGLSAASAATSTTQAGLAATSAATATTQATTATTQAGLSAASAVASDASADAAAIDAATATTQAGIATTQAGLAATLYDSFDDRYLGAKAADPTLDNDGNALLTGALYFNTGSTEMRVWSGAAWNVAYVPVAGYAALGSVNTFTADQTIQFSDDGATAGPTMNLTRVSASPAANDLLGLLNFRGRDSVAADTIYARIQAQLMDPVNGSEDGRFVFYCMQAGTLTIAATLQLGLFMPGATDQGVGTINGILYNSGVALGTMATQAASAVAITGGTATGFTSLGATGAAPFTATYVDAGALVGPTATLLRDSVSPAASDLLGSLLYQGRDSGAALQTYASIGATITDPTAASEDATLDFWTVVAGAVAARGHWGAGFYSDGVTGGDKGAGTLNFTTIYEANVLLSAKYAALAGATFVGGVTATAFTEGATLLSAKYAPIASASLTGGAAIVNTSQDVLTLTFTDAAAGSGPVEILDRVSASPAALDQLGYINFRGRDSGGNPTDYATISASIIDPTNGSEDGAYVITTFVAGASAARAVFAGGLYMGGALTDQGVGTINATGLFINGARIAPTISRVTATGTWNRPTGCLAVYVRGVGAGGGGGGADSPVNGDDDAAGGGGAGEYFEKYIAAAPSSLSITIGAAGTAGTNAGTNGGTGGTTTVTGHASGIGGSGGTGVNADGANGAGGNGGTGGTAGDQNFPGQAGEGAIVSGTNSTAKAGSGGSPYAFGQGGRSPGAWFPNATTAGVNGIGYGAGGGGARSTTTAGAAGGTGSPGYVEIWEFYS